MYNLTERKRILEKHIEEEHHRSPVAEYIKEVIYGGVDGIVTTFAVVAGFSGAALSNEATTELSFMIVLLFGLANLFADATSMGLGNFLSVRSAQAFYHKDRAKEEHWVKYKTEHEFQETITILMQRGYEEEDATVMASLYRKNPEYWTDFMMTHELKLADPRGDNPVFTAIATFFSFIIFGTIPLLPFILIQNTTAMTAFMYSIAGTFIALVILSILKWRVVGNTLWRSLFEVILVGGTAATVAFVVGTLFML